MFLHICKNVINEFKNLYGRFGINSQGRFEYYLKLGDYFFCKKKNLVMVVIQVRHKRSVEIIPVKELILDRDLIKELHPADACIIGILSNNERNGIYGMQTDNFRKMKKIRQLHCFTKSRSLLTISKKYFNKYKGEVTVLHSSILNKEIEILTTDLASNEALLYALDPFQAITVGYDVSEFHFRKIH